MGAPKGNQFWKIRSDHGRAKIFASADILWQEAVHYFEWCDKHPLKEQKAFAHKGIIKVKSLNKLRAYTLGALCLFLDVTESYFRSFKHERKDSENQSDIDFLTVIARIERVIYHQKFAGAAADLLNANIIARDLGLVDKQKIDASNVNYSTVDLTKEEAKKISDGLEGDF